MPVNYYLYLFIFYCSLVNVPLTGAQRVGSQLVGVENESPFTDVRKNYKQQLAQEEQELLHEYFSLVGITEKKWDWYKKQCERSYQYEEAEIKKEAQQRLGKPLSVKLMACVRNLLQQSGLDPNVIEIISEGSGKYSEAYTSEQVIYIYEPYLHLFYDTWSEIESTIMHEIQHIVHHDNFLNFCFNEVLHEKIGRMNIQAIKRWNNWIKRWQHFRERRADILAGLSDINYAQSRVVIAQNCLASFEDVEEDSHPKWATRLAYMQEVLKHMQCTLAKVFTGSEAMYKPETV